MATDTHETITDIIAWLRRPIEGENAYLTLWRNEIADRLDAALKRELAATTEKSSAVGDAAKLREALVRVRDFADRIVEDRGLALAIINACDAALSAPPCNCDVGSAEEQMKRQHDTMCNTTKACPDWSCKKCFAEWSQKPYEEGGAK